ncbi:MAG TPA: HU family DNA-binding protein [Syntrophales bacterium]|nr:HU family DNA-binding protein [Syntrophales bacterium]
MTKKELIKKVQEEIEVYPDKDISYAVHLVFDAMIGALKRNERIEIRGFGNFTVRSRRPILGRNPKTSNLVHVPGRKIPFFKVGKELQDMINGRK